MEKYSDIICEWLYDIGYRKCFYVAGGNIMHFLDSASRRFDAVPVIHEVAGTIAAEYYNEAQSRNKAFVLVTAGPGLTNSITGIAGAYVESRELLIIGGQVKRADLSHGKVRQRGIQEIDGVTLVKPITKKSVRLDRIINKTEFRNLVKMTFLPRKGPVFIEMPLDIQGQKVEATEIKSEAADKVENLAIASSKAVKDIAARFNNAARPVLLLGGGVSRKKSEEVYKLFSKVNAPIMTSYNGADRIGAEHELYFGRPNTWGQRYANIIAQQADLLVAVGTRLGMQQTGFNWQQFIPHGKIVQVDCDKAELDKGHPKIDLPVCADANQFLQDFLAEDLGVHNEWLDYARMIKAELPLAEENKSRAQYISPYHFYLQLSGICTKSDVLIPCSSGGAFTVSMQSIIQKRGQVIITNKGSASMGYGLSGAIGAAIACAPKRTILVEGDGGFAQNLQEIGTAAAQKLNLKIFIFDDNGYASIRMTQKSYFGGRYVGCDSETGLGLPDWEKLFEAYKVPHLRLKPGFTEDKNFKKLFDIKGIAAFIVPVDPEQTYFPKITSRILPDGGMESNPLHLMSPPLPDDVMAKVGKYLNE